MESDGCTGINCKYMLIEDSFTNVCNAIDVITKYIGTEHPTEILNFTQRMSTLKLLTCARINSKGKFLR